MTRLQTLALSALTLGTFLTVAPIVGAPLICLAIGAALLVSGFVASLFA